MKKIFIETLNQLIEFDSSIKSLKFNNQLNYRELSFNLFDNFTFSIDNNTIDLNKNSLIIYNPFEIDLNEKKLLTSMYKELEKEINDDDRIYIQKIESECFNLLENLLINYDYNFEYSESIDINKLFQALDIHFPTIEYSNYLELIVNYFKLYSKYCKTKIVISFGLLDLLSNDEISLLEKELEYIELILLDISYIGNLNKNENVFIIEEDWCII